MRVLLMNHFPLTGSGSGVYTLNIARALVRKGHEVCIIFPENEAIDLDDLAPIKLHPVYFDNCAAGALNFDFPCFTTHPRSVTTFFELTDAQISSYEQAFRTALDKEMREFKPDIIHCGHIWLQASYAADYKIPLIITAHGTDLIGYRKSTRFRTAARRAFDAAFRIIAISNDNQDLVGELFEDNAKCQLIRNGYDPEIIYPEDTSVREVLDIFDIQHDYDTIISFAAKFAYFKGIDILLQGAKLYDREGVATIVAGDGELFEEMTALKNSLSLDNVYFVHNQTHEVLRKLYNSAKLSLLTSRNEPFGLVAIEALACGTPVIASNEGGPLDIITPQVGLLFESENPADLANKVRLLLDDEVLFDREYVASYAREKYSQDNSINLLIDVYTEALKSLD